MSERREPKRRTASVGVSIAPVAIIKYRMGADGADEMLEASPGCADIWEIPADELRADVARIWAMVDPEDVERLRGSIEASAASRSAWEHDWRITTPSGARKWLHGRGLPSARDADGIVWDTIILDVSAQKQVEEALRDSERSFRDLAETVPGAIFRYQLGPDGVDRVDYMSQGCLDLWELPPESVQNDPAPLWAMVHPEDLPAMAESVRRSSETLEPWRHSWRITTPSGERKWLEGRGVPTALENGSVLWNSLILDVTEQKRTEQELRRLANAAESADRAKTEFLAHMSHELRTPLNSIIGFAEVKQTEALGPLENPQYREYSALIHRSGRHLLSVIGDLLDVSMIEAGGQHLHESEETLEEILAFTRDVMRDRMIERDLAYREDAPPDPIRLAVDAVKLKRAILNVLANAVRHSPPGGDVTVRVAASAEAGLRIAVDDAGPGIPAAEVPRLLEPFTRAQDSPLLASEGAGLGLYITKSILEAHGGGLDIGRSESGGASVALTLPPARVRPQSEAGSGAGSGAAFG